MLNPKPEDKEQTWRVNKYRLRPRLFSRTVEFGEINFKPLQNKFEIQPVIIQTFQCRANELFGLPKKINLILWMKKDTLTFKL
jgi:hypothetical protein